MVIKIDFVDCFDVKWKLYCKLIFFVGGIVIFFLLVIVIVVVGLLLGLI